MSDTVSIFYYLAYDIGKKDELAVENMQLEEYEIINNEGPEEESHE